MQTIDQLLVKIITLQASSKEAGHKPDVVSLTSEDELTLIIHEWKKGDLRNKAPEVRLDYSNLAGLQVHWDAPETLVRPQTPEEKQANKAQNQRNMQGMEADLQRLEANGRSRRGLG